LSEGLRLEDKYPLACVGGESLTTNISKTKTPTIITISHEQGEKGEGHCGFQITNNCHDGEGRQKKNQKNGRKAKANLR